MRPALLSMVSTDSTARPMATTPSSAAPRTALAWWWTTPTTSALCCTALLSCSTLTTVWARLVACSSVRSDSAWCSFTSCCPACATRAALLRTSATMPDSEVTMPPSKALGVWTSPAPSWEAAASTATRWLRSPWAMPCMACCSNSRSPITRDQSLCMPPSSNPAHSSKAAQTQGPRPIESATNASAGPANAHTVHTRKPAPGPDVCLRCLLPSFSMPAPACIAVCLSCHWYLEFTVCEAPPHELAWPQSRPCQNR